MEKILNEYPEYKKNQVLTEISLNTTSGFLEQQIRLSRFGLTQTGIIEDLRYNVGRIGTNKIDHITINKGFGVSIDGYFIPHNYNNAEVVYTHCKEYQFILKEKQIDPATVVKITRNDFLNELPVPPFAQQPLGNINFDSVTFYELLTAEMAAKEKTPVLLKNLASGNYKLALFLESQSKSFDTCTPNSCDDGGNLVTQRTVPLLINDSTDLLVKKINRITKQGHFIRLKRFSNLCLLRNTKASKREVLLTEYSILNKQNTQALIDKLDEIIRMPIPLSIEEKWLAQNTTAMANAREQLRGFIAQYIPDIEQFIDAAMTQKINGKGDNDYPYNYGFVAQQTGKIINKWTSAFKLWTVKPRFSRLKSTVVDSAATKYFQYYYDFCMDLAQAINEYIVQYNHFVTAYKTGYQHRLRQMLVLGTTMRKTINDPYSYLAIESFANDTYRNAKDIFFRHFNRIPVLIQKFNAGFAELKYRTAIKLTPSRYRCCLLEEKAIPFYYRQDLELEKNWIVNHMHKPLTTNIYQYRDLVAPYTHFAYGLNGYGSMRIEGIIGKSKEEVTKELDALRYYFNVPLYYSFIDIEKLVLDAPDGNADMDALQQQYFVGSDPKTNPRNTFVGMEHIGGVEFGYHFVIVLAVVQGDTKIVIADFQAPVPYHDPPVNLPGKKKISAGKK